MSTEKHSDIETSGSSQGQSQDGNWSPPTDIIGALDWDGPDDPDNPMNWPSWKKILHSAIPAIYSFGLATCISTFVAAIPIIQLQFDVSRTASLMVVSLYTVGFVIGPCIASPYPNFASDNFKVLVIFRFLAGVGGSGVLAVGAGTLSDLWKPQQVGRVAIAYILAPFLGPSIGPLIGAYTLHEYHNHWKWAVWVVLCILAPVGISLPFMKETSKERILYARAKTRGHQFPEETFSVTLSKIGKGFLKPLHMCVAEPVAICIGLYTAFSFAMVFSFFGSYAYVYTKVYHFNMRQIGLCYIPVIIGFLFAVATFGFFDATKYRKEAIRTNNRVAPEFRLYSALVGCWLVPIGLFWYAWAPHENVHWIVPVLAGFPFGWGTLANFLACMAYIVDTYGTANGASAVAANGILRFLLGAAFPLFIFQVYQKMGIHWAGSLFAFISVAFIPVPWIFFLKGPELRKRSHYSTATY
ncbi:Polyamine transporter 4 [Cladobotryum mycophilum]|uniref:Polyamine transporter 4 n=1 Tax=Cladobotryum mycophilum TaxID=491253 RepID=A0ABR0T0E8_9HYPO